MPQYPISKSAPSYSLSLSSKEHLNSEVTSNKMANKDSVDYQPSSSRLTSKIFRVLPLVYFYFDKDFVSPEYLSNIFSNLHIPLWSSDYWKIHYQVKKLKLGFFTNSPKTNSTPGSLSPRRREITHPPRQCFLKIYPTAERGWEI